MGSKDVYIQIPRTYEYVTLWQRGIKFTGEFLRLFIYLFLSNTAREAETQAEGEAGSIQGARRGTPSWDSRITP